ncbi:MAG: L-2-amino-thiazoline-4-carboxylic acid hydrolase [Candidatus Hermodarchaeota archaeon]
MKIQKVDIFRPNKKISVNIPRTVESCLLALDRFLVYLAEHRNADILENFIPALEEKYKSEALNSFNNANSLDLSNLNILMETPELLEATIALILTLLDVPKNYNWESQEINLPQINATKAWVVPKYYYAKQLTELIDKKEAHQFLKDYFEFYVNTYRKASKFEDLNSVHESDIEGVTKNENGAWRSVVINNGRYVSRVTNCMAHEALKVFNDPELAYIVCCSSDSALIKKINENFVLTRTSTLMNGPYCDFCTHDTRIVDKVEHLSKEFFESLG